MTYDARQVANWFITRAAKDGRTLSIMSLLKLTYIAHGWHLEMQAEPLIADEIQAWQYGPVIPSVYNEFRGQKLAVTKIADSKPDWSDIDQADETLLEQIWTIYGKVSPFKLSEITHVSGGPWDIATRTGGFYAKISDDMILEHYRRLREERAPKNMNQG